MERQRETLKSCYRRLAQMVKAQPMTKKVMRSSFPPSFLQAICKFKNVKNNYKPYNMSEFILILKIEESLLLLNFYIYIYIYKKKNSEESLTPKLRKTDKSKFKQP